MTASGDGAALRVAQAAATSDVALAHDLLDAVREFLAMWADPETLDPGSEEIPRLHRLHAFAAALESELRDV
jgi:hypothetical protein